MSKYDGYSVYNKENEASGIFNLLFVGAAGVRCQGHRVT